MRLIGMLVDCDSLRVNTRLGSRWLIRSLFTFNGCRLQPNMKGTESLSPLGYFNWSALRGSIGDGGSETAILRWSQHCLRLRRQRRQGPSVRFLSHDLGWYPCEFAKLVATLVITKDLGYLDQKPQVLKRQGRVKWDICNLNWGIADRMQLVRAKLGLGELIRDRVLNWQKDAEKWRKVESRWVVHSCNWRCWASNQAIGDQKFW